jgi:hypothetical protein
MSGTFVPQPTVCDTSEVAVDQLDESIERSPLTLGAAAKEPGDVAASPLDVGPFHETSRSS